MQTKRFTLFISALSLLWLALFIPPIFAVAEQSDGRLAIPDTDVESNEALTEPSTLPEQELVAIVALNDIELRKLSGNNTIHLPITMKQPTPTPTATPSATPSPIPSNTPRPTASNTPRPAPSATPASGGEAPDSIYDIDGTFRASNGTDWLRFNPSAQGLHELLRGNVQSRGFAFLVDEVEYEKTGSDTATLEGRDRSLVFAGVACRLEGEVQFTSPDTFRYSGTVRVWIPFDSSVICALPREFDDTFTRE